MGIVVIGSLNMDMTVRTLRAPEAGETVFGQAFALAPGGKGANQAVAAARLGAEVTMIGAVGRDAFGEQMLEIMRQENVNADYMMRSETEGTGVAAITVDAEGENRIIVVPGANMALRAADIDRLEPVIRQAQVLLLQLETDLDMCARAVAVAHRHGVPVILNPAPARALPAEMLRQVTYLTPNESEAALLSGLAVDSLESAEQAGRALLAQGVQGVIVTLGAKGALIVNDQGCLHIPGFAVQAVDTVAAGDSFSGALATRLVAGDTLTEAVSYSGAVGALTVSKRGAIEALPTLAEVERFLASGHTGKKA
ncbi:ribokinase [Paenibacillus sp. NFR01]|uniref:ribokinase n=1 Tax=Paenibacillus sp. NFR01 TaxID=1566279 RepID=UPI0008B81067|nr:ribokinase [Paenibacillus sp. NFR01]